MYQYFNFLKDYFKAWESQVSIDNECCRFHYRYSSIIFMVCCILVGTKEIFGQDIECSLNVPSDSNNFLNAYCYYQYVYTVVNKSDHGAPSIVNGQLGFDVTSDAEGRDGKGAYERRYHTYYQWVATVLFLQAIVFYLPHYFWKIVEGGRLKTLVDGLRLAKYAHVEEEISSQDVIIPTRSKVRNKLDVIKKDLVLRFRSSCTFSAGLVLCELANLLNVILQVYLTNEFLDGLFLRVGFVAAEDNFYTGSVMLPPLNKIFPKVALCEYNDGGLGFGMVRKQAICVLHQNNTNDKVYTALWYWFIILFSVSLMAVLWRLFTMVFYKTDWLTRALFNREDNPRELRDVVRLCYYSDWLFLVYLHKNTCRVVFADIVSSIASELKERYDDANGSSAYSNSEQFMKTPAI